MNRKSYPTDLTDKQWGLIKDLIPPEKTGGRHRTTDMRGVISGILYVLKGGIQWRFDATRFSALVYCLWLLLALAQ